VTAVFCCGSGGIGGGYYLVGCQRCVVLLLCVSPAFELVNYMGWLISEQDACHGFFWVVVHFVMLKQFIGGWYNRCMKSGMLFLILWLLLFMLILGLIECKGGGGLLLTLFLSLLLVVRYCVNWICVQAIC